MSRFIFGSSNLTSFIFNFLGSPFKSLQKRLASPQPEDTGLIPQTTPEDNHHHHHQDATSEEPTQKQPTHQDIIPTSSQMAPTVSIEDSLPTAFMPNFPSLSRPSTSQSNQSAFSLPSVSSSRVVTSTQNKMPTRRTLYTGPGHSSMNSSTRLGIARRKRLGISKSSHTLGSNLDASPQVHLESSNEQVPIQSNHVPELSGTPKRIKVENNNSDSGLSSANAISLPARVDKTNLRLIRNSHITPMRPSPLRNVTLPSAVSSPGSQHESSPAAQTTDSPRSRKRNHKKAASIMSSVMKEVNLEMNNRSPAPSPIKPSSVINPYSHLQQRIVKNKPISRQSVVSKKTTSSVLPTHTTLSDLQERESRKRKVQVCLDGQIDNRPSQSDWLDATDSHQKSIEQILQTTMPKEFCLDQTNSSNGAQKKKTRQVGKLPERVLKKQKLREQESKSNITGPSIINKSSEIVGRTHNDDTNCLENNHSPVGKSSSQSKPNQLNSRTTSPTKTFQQVPSPSSLFITTNLNSKSASSRDSLLNAKHQQPTTTKISSLNNDFHEESCSAPHHSSIVVNSARDSKSFDSIYQLQVEKEKRIEEKVGEKEVKINETESEQGDEAVAEEEKRIKKLVKKFKPEEISNYFNEDLLIHRFNSEPVSLPNNNPSNSILDVNFNSVKEVVLGMSSDELPCFLFV